MKQSGNIIFFVAILLVMPIFSFCLNSENSTAYSQAARGFSINLPILMLVDFVSSSTFSLHKTSIAIFLIPINMVAQIMVLLSFYGYKIYEFFLGDLQLYFSFVFAVPNRSWNSSIVWILLHHFLKSLCIVWSTKYFNQKASKAINSKLINSTLSQPIGLVTQVVTLILAIHLYIIVTGIIYEFTPSLATYTSCHN